MAHPMKGKCSEAREVGRARYKAEGGRINPSTGAPSRPLSSTKSEMDVPGPSPGAYRIEGVRPGDEQAYKKAKSLIRAMESKAKNWGD